MLGGGLKERLSGPDGSLTLAGYRDAAGVRACAGYEMQSEMLGM